MGHSSNPHEHKYDNVFGSMAVLGVSRNPTSGQPTNAQRTAMMREFKALRRAEDWAGIKRLWRRYQATGLIAGTKQVPPMWTGPKPAKPKRNPARRPNYGAIRNRLWKAEADYERLNNRYQFERAKPTRPGATVAHQRKLIGYRMRLQTLADKVKALSARLFPDG